jgi:hypothetical protein
VLSHNKKHFVIKYKKKFVSEAKKGSNDYVAFGGDKP